MDRTTLFRVGEGYQRGFGEAVCSKKTAKALYRLDRWRGITPPFVIYKITHFSSGNGTWVEALLTGGFSVLRASFSLMSREGEC